MLKVTAYDQHAEIKILPDPVKSKGKKKSNFYGDLNRIKNDIEFGDRKFDRSKKVWIITNIEKYAEVPYMFYAIEARKMQPTLF
jgi:hypothetical protein